MVNITKNVKMKSGIYKITNIINGKYYIGSSKDIKSRFRSHKCVLKANKSASIILQNAVNKYGLENFLFEVIEYCENYKEREIEILSQKLPPYNSILETTVRREISKESREKMRISHLERYKKFPAKKGYKRENFTYPKGYPVKLTDVKTGEILKFECVKDVCSYFKTTTSTVYQAINKGNLYKWKYKVEKL